MEFFNSAVDTLQTIVIGLGGALCVWGGVNLLEGYGQDNPASNHAGVKVPWSCASSRPLWPIFGNKQCRPLSVRKGGHCD